MVSLMQLWVPILLSGLFVFLASSVIHMVLKYHNSEYRKLPNEDEIRAAIRKAAPSPGQYIMPHCLDPKEQAKPEVQQKYTEGPVGTVTIMQNGLPNMGPMLGQWFAFNLVVSLFVAYLASRTLPIGTEYLKVFQVAGTVGFVSYALGAMPGSIWMGKPWSATFKDMFDGLIYGLVTGGTFGWLWPRG